MRLDGGFRAFFFKFFFVFCFRQREREIAGGQVALSINQRLSL